MKRLETLVALALVLVLSATASATTIRTSAFPGAFFYTYDMALCAVLNGGSTPGGATVQLFDADGNVLDTLAIARLDAHSTANTEGHFFVDGTPSYCQCTVPSATWRCSYIFLNSNTGAPTVIEAR